MTMFPIGGGGGRGPVAARPRRPGLNRNFFGYSHEVRVVRGEGGRETGRQGRHVCSVLAPDGRAAVRRRNAVLLEGPVISPCPIAAFPDRHAFREYNQRGGTRHGGTWVARLPQQTINNTFFASADKVHSCYCSTPTLSDSPFAAGQHRSMAESQNTWNFWMTYHHPSRSACSAINVTRKTIFRITFSSRAPRRRPKEKEKTETGSPTHRPTRVPPATDLCRLTLSTVGVSTSCAPRGKRRRQRQTRTTRGIWIRQILRRRWRGRGECHRGTGGRELLLVWGDDGVRGWEAARSTRSGGGLSSMSVVEGLAQRQARGGIGGGGGGGGGSGSVGGAGAAGGSAAGA